MSSTKASAPPTGEAAPGRSRRALARAAVTALGEGQSVAARSPVGRLRRVGSVRGRGCQTPSAR
ncbi:hypothetical protein SMA5143A_5775 [Streptomyces sp. MA5143a]|nr:hypothetical protein SMA5143A_5775 [Streptomyces sp. MA5143a]